jgi:outer membrane receptor protein involved in Fe transport
MRKVTSHLVAFLLANILTITAFAQAVTVSGNVKNSNTKEAAGAVSVFVKGTDNGTFTDDKGNFRLSVKNLPVTLVISSIGFEPQEISVSSASAPINVAFIPASSLGQEIVVSASRVPQKIMESPVSIERVSAATIRNAPVSNFYDVVTNLKGVDVTTSSLTFKTPTTRGFNGSGNTRFNQLVDGMDNQAPGLNFSVAAIIGLSELDVDNIELLSGASSALYGPGGMNGTLLMTSKNPFKYQGLSFLVKEGIMHTDKRQRDASAYHNWNVRWAKKISEKFAFKINMELIQAKDWQGTDYRNYARAATNGAVKAGDRSTDPNYDGINVYGDETTAEIRSAVLNAIGASAAPFLKNFIDTLNGGRPINVSRTGYTEKEVTNPNTVNYKIAGSLHYKVTENTEAVFAAYWGTGNTVYTGSERYSLKDFKMGQYKLELNNKNWSLRAYTTQENAGESYNTTVATRLFNESWKPSGGSTGWFSQYSQTYLGARLNGLSDAAAHAAARSTADVGRPLSSSERFRTAYDSIRKKPIKEGGALFLDKSDLYSVEGNYNLSHITKKFADILIGANFKRYVLNSEGTLFADSTGPVSINEYGAYIQASRKLMDRITITLSGRYDKNQNFKGRFTPRATMLFKVKENNNIRVSYQTAYRFPSNQQQFINLAVGSVRLIGGNQGFAELYNFAGNPLYDFEELRKGNIVAVNAKELKPESISSFEAGYKGLLLKDKLLIDLYGYYGQYQDFLGRLVTVQSNTGSQINLGDTSLGNRLSIPVNSADKVKSYGFGASFDYRLPKNFTISVNFASDVLKDVPTTFVAYFNAPKYKVNAALGNTGFGKNKRLGFNAVYRYVQGFLYQGDFASGNLEDVHTVDAQVSYRFPSSKSILKLGATNLLNQYYYNAIGNSQIGGLYYVSFGYNIY